MLRTDGRRLAWACVGAGLVLVAWEAISLACRWIAAARDEYDERYRLAAHMAFETRMIAEAMGRGYDNVNDFARALDVNR